jgi:hypothetical protein
VGNFNIEFEIGERVVIIQGGWTDTTGIVKDKREEKNLVLIESDENSEQLWFYSYKLRSTNK